MGGAISTHFTLNPLDFPALIASFELELAALIRSKSTRRIYLSSVEKFVQWLDVSGHPPSLDRRLVQAWIKELLDNGAEPTTVAARIAGLRQFTKWAGKEGEIPAGPLLGLNTPRAPMKVTPVLTEAQLKALIQARQGLNFETGERKQSSVDGRVGNANW